jgi:UDP-N-acetylglucosamine 2-epimerase (non-hydrolysing)
MGPERSAGIVVSIGTKAQYIKMAPVLRELDARGIDYLLVYTGQHSETFDALERSFGTRAPDDVIVPLFEAATHASFARWTWRFWRGSLQRERLAQMRRARLVVVHGDTASTLFAALVGRLCGLTVAHVEAGLRSESLLDPFPEELIRRCVSRLARLHFAPDETARAALARAGGTVIDTGGNTLRDALAIALRRYGELPAAGGGGKYAVVSIHRNENLSRKREFDLLMQVVLDASTRLPVKFVLHPATRERLKSTGWGQKFNQAAGVELLERMDHAQFVRLLIDASFLMTDGGSNQEEAAMLGLPALLLRRTTERPDGLGDCVTLSRLDPATIAHFIQAHAGRHWNLRLLDATSPSACIVDHLQTQLIRPASS